MTGLKPFAKKSYLFIFGPKIIVDIVGKKPKLIAVCHPDYRGVKSATKMLTEDIIESSEMVNRFWADRVARLTCAYGPETVLISGYSDGYDLLAEKIKRLLPDTRVLFYVHSSFTWFDNYPAENATFSKVLKLNKTGVVSKIGFCKRDLADYFKYLGYNTCFVMNRFDLTTVEKKRNVTGTIKVGVWGNNWWHRNILNQVIGALMIPGAEAHVNELKEVDFIDNKRVIRHGFLPKKEFLQIFSQMDINLYVSFTDCFPMTLIESMQYGIPAIASDTSAVYSFSPYLREALVVSTVDSPIGIAEKIGTVVKDYDKIKSEIAKYLPVLKKEVEESIKEFLS